MKILEGATSLRRVRPVPSVYSISNSESVLIARLTTEKLRGSSS